MSTAPDVNIPASPGPQRVLIVNERYANPAGEDAAVNADLEMLRSRNHLVEHWLVDNRVINEWGMPRRLSLAWKTTWNTDSSRKVRELTERIKPDLIHIHNTLPIISPAAVHAAHQSGIPVVFTVHNYRLLCPAGEFFREGRPCEECHTRSLLRGVLHGCYRGSRAQTAVVAAMLATHRAIGTWSRCVDAFVAPSAFLKSKLVEAGFDPRRIHVRPNTVHVGSTETQQSGDYALFAGRLIAEKGILTLLDAVASSPGVRLIILGEGPLEPEVRKRAEASSARFVYKGQLGRDETAHWMAGARVLVFPSLLYETFGMTLVEALAHGVPVITSSVGSRGEIVRDGQEGLMFNPADSHDLAAKLSRLMADDSLRAAMSARARARFNDAVHGGEKLPEAD